MRSHLPSLVAMICVLLYAIVNQTPGTSDDKPKAPIQVGSIQVEVKGIMACKRIGEAYVSVRHEDGETTRIWFWEPEGKWRVLRDVFPMLDGQEVVVRGQIRQLPEKSSTSIPQQALYFSSWEIQTKAGEKIR